MEKKKDKMEIQELIMQFQVINQQIEALQKQIESLEESMYEVESSMKGIDEINKSGNNKEILVPIVSGIFAKAQITNTDDFIVNVGSNVAVSKSSTQVKNLLKEHKDSLQKTQYSFASTLENLTSKAKEIEEILMKLKE